MSPEPGREIRTMALLHVLWRGLAYPVVGESCLGRPRSSPGGVDVDHMGGLGFGLAGLPELRAAAFLPVRELLARASPAQILRWPDRLSTILPFMRSCRPMVLCQACLGVLLLRSSPVRVVRYQAPYSVR